MSGTRIHCPTDTHDADGNELDVIGCGSTEYYGPDEEGLYDCANCGMWWHPASEGQLQDHEKDSPRIT